MSETEPDEITYELDEWEPELLARLDLELHRVGVPHSWEDDVVLVVDAEHEPQVDAVLDRIEHPDALPVEPDPGGVADVDLLGDLFLAADRLRRDPSHLTSIEVMIERGPNVQGRPALYGLTEEGWELVQLHVALIRRNLLDGEHPLRVQTDAERLRSMLRPIV